MWEFIRQVGGEAPNGLLRLQHLHMLVACRASAPIHQLELIAKHEHDQGGQISPADHLHRTLGTIRSEDCKRALQIEIGATGKKRRQVLSGPEYLAEGEPT